MTTTEKMSDADFELHALDILHRDPGCHFPPGEEKIFAGLGVSLEIEADAENGDEVQGYDRHVYAGERNQARRALNEDGWEQGHGGKSQVLTHVIACIRVS